MATIGIAVAVMDCTPALSWVGMCGYVPAQVTYALIFHQLRGASEIGKVIRVTLETI